MAEKVDFKLFRYYPNYTAAVIFVIAFVAISILHTYQLCRTRVWFFTVFVVGGYFQVIGYVARAIASKQSPNWTVPVYSIHTILVLVAPALYAASIYMILGRIILITNGEKYSLVPRRFLTKAFVVGDVISFFMQAAGGGIMASGTISALHTGENIIICGLVVQILFFSCFVITAGILHYRMLLYPTQLILRMQHLWQKHLNVLYLTSVLIWIRCVFRLIEYAQGNDGYLISHEAYLYIFDALLMLLVMLVMAVIHPSEIGATLNGGNAKMVEKMIFVRPVDSYQEAGREGLENLRD